MVSWNQRRVLLRNIIWFIKKYHIKSLLDVGAGDAAFAKSIAEHVQSYTAVEKNGIRVRQLKAGGLKTIKGIFPSIHVAGKYDMVLSSHSIPERTNLVSSFVKKAHQLLKPNGLLLVVTFKGSKGDIFRITEQLYGKGVIHDRFLFQELVSQLQRLGKVKIVRKNSTVKSDNLAEILNVVLTSIGVRKSKKYRKRIQTILQAQFKKHSVYSIHFEHLFIIL